MTSAHTAHTDAVRTTLVLGCDVPQAVAAAAAYAPLWQAVGVAHRAALLERAADLYEAGRARLMALVVREGGKTVSTALGEVREAVDYLRYYAGEARRHFSVPAKLPVAAEITGGSEEQEGGVPRPKTSVVPDALGVESTHPIVQGEPAKAAGGPGPRRRSSSPPPLPSKRVGRMAMGTVASNSALSAHSAKICASGVG